MALNIKSKNKTRRQSNRGFTVIELMIATTVFSIVLVVATSGVVAIGRLYHKNLTSARTQEAARSIIDQVVRARQFSGDNKSYSLEVSFDGYTAFCFGEARFSYKINQKVEDGGPRGLVYAPRTVSDSCTPETSTGEEMLGTNMRLLDFGVTSIGEEKYRIAVKVAYGDDDLLTHYADDGTRIDADGMNGVDNGDFLAAQCKNGIAGSNFCGVSELATIVTKRIK